MNTRENFKNDRQYKRWLDYVEFFNKIIKLQNDGITIWYNYDSELTSLNKMEFYINKNCGNECHLYERNSKTAITCWIGSTHDYNPKNDSYDFIHIEESIKDFTKKYGFRYFSNEVFVN